MRGLLIEIAGPVGAMSLGGRIDIEIDRGSVPCEVIGFAGDRALAMPFGSLQGFAAAARAFVRAEAGGVRPTSAWAGRVIDALGRPIDGKGLCPPAPFSIRFGTIPAGPRGRGWRGRSISTFGHQHLPHDMRGPAHGHLLVGVGKSVLLSMLAHTAADVAVIGLVGERGRGAGIPPGRSRRGGARAPS